MAATQQNTSSMTTEEIKNYINSLCADTSFLCGSDANKNFCTESIYYTGLDAINKTCDDIDKGKQCDTDFNECMVTTDNLFDEDGGTIKTSFVNIIIPITNAFDAAANQKFLRLPALSSSKKPKSQSICNVCACMNRFSSSPGASASVGQNSYTSPGQDTCIYPDFIEHYYYPINVQHFNEKIVDKPPVKLGNYNVLNKNIIFAHSEDDLNVGNLYELLTQNGISTQITKDFILKVLYKNDEPKEKELALYIINKEKRDKKDIENGSFYKNVSFFYGITVTFIFWILFLLL
jgi:hypothetical protein